MLHQIRQLGENKTFPWGLLKLQWRREWCHGKQDQHPDATPRPSGEASHQKPPEGVLFPKISFSAHQKIPSSHWVHCVLSVLSLSFHLSCFLLHLVECRLEQIFEDTKAPFTVAIWKITFCAIYLVCFFGGEMGGASFLRSLGWTASPSLQRSRPAAYKCLKEGLLLLVPKPPQSLAE